MAIILTTAPFSPPAQAGWVTATGPSGTQKVYDQSKPRERVGQGTRKANVGSGLVGLGIGEPNGARALMQKVALAWRAGGGTEQGDPGLPGHTVSRAAWNTFAAGTPWPGIYPDSPTLHGFAWFYAINAVNQQAGFSVFSGPDYFPPFGPVCSFGDPAGFSGVPTVTSITAYAGTTPTSWFLHVEPWLLHPQPTGPPPQFVNWPALLVSMSGAIGQGQAYYPGLDRGSGYNVFEDTSPGAPPQTAEFVLSDGMGPRTGTGPVRLYVTARWVQPLVPWEFGAAPWIGPSNTGQGFRQLMDLP